MIRIAVKVVFKICGALRDLVPFVQFKKSEKHPWRSVKVVQMVPNRATHHIYGGFSGNPFPTFLDNFK